MSMADCCCIGPKITIIGAPNQHDRYFKSMMITKGVQRTFQRSLTRIIFGIDSEKEVVTTSERNSLSRLIVGIYDGIPIIRGAPYGSDYYRRNKKIDPAGGRDGILRLVV